MFRKSLITLALLAGSTVMANAAGDAKAGAAIFGRCAVCHTNDKGGGDGLGPNLFGVVGRKAASRPGYAYSPPMRKSGIIWTDVNLIHEPKLDEYVTAFTSYSTEISSNVPNPTQAFHVRIYFFN